MLDKHVHTVNLQNEVKRHQDRLTFSASLIRLPIVCCCKTSQPLWAQTNQVQIWKCWLVRCKWCVHSPADAIAILSSLVSLTLILGHSLMPDCPCFFVEKGHCISVFNVNKIPLFWHPKSSQLISDSPKSLEPLLSAYNTTLSSLLDKHVPIVNKLSRRQSPSNPWFTATLRAFRSTLRHAENIWKRTHSAADWS